MQSPIMDALLVEVYSLLASGINCTYPVSHQCPVGVASIESFLQSPDSMKTALRYVDSH
jgi:hypothetical protein